jgi:hypothetical protein
MYVLFRRKKQNEWYFVGAFSQATGAPRISKDLTKAHAFKSVQEASQFATEARLLEFRVGNRR